MENLALRYSPEQRIRISSGEIFGGNRYYSHKNTSSTTPYNPRGSLDSISGGKGTVHVYGWAFDEDNLNAQLTIRVYVGSSVYETTANTLRNDITSGYPGVGACPGFSADIPEAKETGTQNVKVVAVNVKGGEDTVLGEQAVTITPKEYFYDKFTAADLGEEFEATIQLVDTGQYLTRVDDSTEAVTPVRAQDKTGLSNQEFPVQTPGRR